MKHIVNTIKAYEAGLDSYLQWEWQCIPQFELAKFMGALPKKARVLDIGCGAGRDCDYFAREGFRVVGLDMSRKMLQAADQLVFKKNRSFVQANAVQLPFKDKSFHGIWSIGTLGHLKKKEVKQVLQQLHKLLKPKGIICIDVPVGEGEHWVKSLEVNMEKRFYSFWNQIDWEEELREAGFEYMSSYESILDNEYVWLVTFSKKV